MADQAAGRRVAVVVVHGVGETTPGYAVNELVDTIEREFPDEFRAKRHSEVHPMTGPPLYEGDDPDSFPATARSADLLRTGERVRFYELYWADRTRTLPGRLNAFLGAFRIIFESHQFIHAMLPKDGRLLTRALRRLLLIAAALLRGPIAALNICLIALALALYFGAALLRGGSGQGLALQRDQMLMVIAGVMAAVAAGALFLFWRRWRRHNTEWNDVYVATFLGALFVAGFAWLLRTYPHVEWIAGKPKEPPPAPVCFYVDRFFYISQLLWAAWGLVMLAALAALGLLVLRRSPEQVGRPAAEAAIGVVAIQSALWIALICIFSLPMLWDASSSGRLPVCSLQDLYFSFAGAAIWSLMVGGTAAVVYWTRWTVARSPKLSLERRAAMTPRMLFGGPIVFAIVAGVVVSLLIFYVQFLNLFGDANRVLAWAKLVSPDMRNGVTEWIAEHQPAFFGGMAALAGGVGFLMAQGFTTAIHIARDLIDHQYSPRLGYSYYLLLPGLRGDLPPRPRRERLRKRLNTVSEELICEEGFDDVVFVVHSQGSVIAYDFLTSGLGSGSGACEQLLAARPHLVTFGSPLGHLYEFYFKEYAALREGIAKLRPTLASWVNLYRVDDYVGRDIRDPDGFVQNIVMPAGGHIDYWKEKKLAEAVLLRIRTPGGAVASAGPRTA